MTKLKLILNTPYSYGKQKYKSDYGFVHTREKIEIGQILKFEELNAISEVSDMHPDHYQYFAGKTFKVTNDLKTKVFNGFVALEV